MTLPAPVSRHNAGIGSSLCVGRCDAACWSPAIFPSAACIVGHSRTAAPTLPSCGLPKKQFAVIDGRCAKSLARHAATAVAGFEETPPVHPPSPFLTRPNTNTTTMSLFSMSHRKQPTLGQLTHVCDMYPQVLRRQYPEKDLKQDLARPSPHLQPQGFKPDKQRPSVPDLSCPTRTARRAGDPSSSPPDRPGPRRRCRRVRPPAILQQGVVPRGQRLYGGSYAAEARSSRP